MQVSFPRALALCGAWAALCGALSVVRAEAPRPGANTPRPPDAARDAAAPELLQKLLDRVARLERELQDLRIRTGQVPADRKDQRVVAVLQTPYLGSVFFGSPTNTRFFACQLMLVNLTNEPLVVKRDDVKLLVDGQTQAAKEPANQFGLHTVQIGNQQLQLRALHMPAQIRLAAGGAGSSWVLFPELPAGNHIPRMVLKFRAGPNLTEIDINESQRAALDMQVERIGPRGCLGVVHLAGVLNSINVGSLIDEVDRLSADKVVRIVVHCAESASITDQELFAWLESSAALGGGGRAQFVRNQFPAFPATIRELHIAALPADAVASNGGFAVRRANTRGDGSRVHETEAEAVLAALHSAYEALPRDELFQTIQSGSRLERAAALAAGAGRLAADKLPAILKCADDDDPVIQQAALAALGHFGEPAAVAKLLEVARKNVEPLSATAVASLAGSRYSAAHAAVLELLGNEDPESKKSIVRILARHPRPIWSDAIYQFVKDPRSGLNVEALDALVQVGHPRLLAVLTEALGETDPQLRQHAFQLLAARPDRESEDAAVNFTLEQLKTTPPTPDMLVLLERVKDRRALPLIMARFDAAPNKSALIQTLAVLGDEDTAKQLAEKYAALPRQDKGAALRALKRLNSAKFHELAMQALLSSDIALISSAVQGLQEDGSVESVQLMIDALDKSGESFAWSHLCNALATAGTPAAKSALTRARDSGPVEKRNFAVSALMMLRQRSPGYQYVYQAQALVKNEKWKEAVEQYNLALQMDPQLPEAYAERANAQMMLGKLAEAGKDFARALELDPVNAQAVTGSCIVMVVQDGKYAEAIRKLEDARSRFPNDSLFTYNSACVYGRVLEYLQKHDKIADRDKLRQQYTRAAIADLQKSVELGFQDYAWFKKDPDLKALQDLPEFQRIVNPGDAPAPAGDDDEGDEGDDAP